MRNESVKWKIWIYRLLPLLAVAEVVLFLVSWLINAAAPELPVRSLLSSEGIRWFIGSFVANLQRPLLVWIVLCCIAVGCLRDSSLLMHIRQLFRRSHLPSFRQRLAFQFVLAELVAFVIILLLLTSIPHAVLLSVTGNLFPGIFSQGIIPILAFVVVVCSLTYGAVSGTLNTLPKAVGALTSGFSLLGILFPLYILGMELFESLRFVF